MTKLSTLKSSTPTEYPTNAASVVAMLKGDEPTPKPIAVQLGFSVAFEDEEHKQFAGHNMPRWKDWDGGQIGGRPSWLQPRDLPKNPILCLNCQDPMTFVCQLYAPADDVNPNAFHRTLYVFGCPNIQCAKSTTGSIRVLRSQLPRDNPFYPTNQEDEESWAMHLPEAWDVHLCQVCHQRGHGKCPIQNYHFCGKNHQKEHKKFVFDKEEQLSKEIDFSFLPSVCADSELVVEEEPIAANASDVKGNKTLFEDDGDDDDDRDLEQEDLNNMTGAQGSSSSKDPATMAFFDRVHGRPDVQEQCLRYLRWPREEFSSSTDGGAPLWIRQDYQPEKIPLCEQCGGERRFECQLMPQMLHYLLKDHDLQKSQNETKQKINSEQFRDAIGKASSILEQAPKEQIPPTFADAKEKAVEAMRTQLLECQNELSWGVVSVYTCVASCGENQIDEGSELGAYREEFAWKQPSLD